MREQAVTRKYSLIKNHSGLSRLQGEISSTSPNPSPRKSLEEKDPVILQQTSHKKSKQTSPVAKIRQFVGMEDTTQEKVPNDVLNKAKGIPAISGKTSGKKRVFTNLA